MRRYCGRLLGLSVQRGDDGALFFMSSGQRAGLDPAGGAQAGLPVLSLGWNLVAQGPWALAFVEQCPGPRVPAPAARMRNCNSYSVRSCVAIARSSIRVDRDDTTRCLLCRSRLRRSRIQLKSRRSIVDDSTCVETLYPLTRCSCRTVDHSRPRTFYALTTKLSAGYSARHKRARPSITIMGMQTAHAARERAPSPSLCSFARVDELEHVAGHLALPFDQRVGWPLAVGRPAEQRGDLLELHSGVHAARVQGGREGGGAT